VELFHADRYEADSGRHKTLVQCFRV